MRRSVSDKTKCLFCYVPSLCLLLINGWKRDSEIRIYLHNVGRVIGVISLQNMLRLKLSYGGAKLYKIGELNSRW